MSNQSLSSLMALRRVCRIQDPLKYISLVGSKLTLRGPMMGWSWEKNLFWYSRYLWASV